MNQRFVGDLNHMRGAGDLLEQLEKGQLLAAQHAGHLADAETDHGAERTITLGPPRAHAIVPAGQDAVPALGDIRLPPGGCQEELDFVDRTGQRWTGICLD
jgi:hypothetical protein